METCWLFAENSSQTSYTFHDPRRSWFFVNARGGNLVIVVAVVVVVIIIVDFSPRWKPAA